MTFDRRLGKMSSAVVNIVLLSCLLLSTVQASSPVPVLIWDTNQAQGGVPAISPLQVVSHEIFHDKYLASFKPNNILLFLQDALSIEDLSSHASEMHTVKEWMASGHSLYLPNVEDPARLAHDLPSHGYNVVLLEPGSKAAGLELKQKDKNLVVVRLPSTITNPSRRRAMQKTDEVMQNVVSKIGAQRDFTVVYTGMKPSVDESTQHFSERIRVARSLKAADSERAKRYARMPRREGFHYGNCSMILLRSNITISTITNSPTPQIPTVIPESRFVKDYPNCHNDVAGIMMKYNNVTINGMLVTEVQITINYKIVGGSWTLDFIKLYESSSVSNTIYKPINSDISGIPLVMSYSCSQKLVLRSVNQTGPQKEMVIDGFQMQVKSSEIWPVRFDGAWDCVGFFTVPIWCGVFTTFLLLFILSFGMVMLADIKTMDRFDDPKGKPVMVTTAAE